MAGPSRARSPAIAPTRVPVRLQLRRLRDLAEPEAGLDAGLDDAERARAARFVRPRDAAAFRMARTLVRTRLGALLGLPPAQVPLVIDGAGRPGCPVAGTPPFSITHCEGLVVVGWGSTEMACPAGGAHMIGIDAEPLSSAIDAPTGTTYLTPEERREIESLEPARRSRARLERFVAKEALLKARGTGFTAEPTALHLVRAEPPGPPRRYPLRWRAADASDSLASTVDVLVLAERWLIGICSEDATPH